MKRGQITIFIIVGIIILVALGVIIAVRTAVVEREVEQARPVIEQVALEFNPLVVYTEDCIKSVSEEGLRKLGEQGGYIYPVDWDGLKFDSAKPTDSDGIVFGEATIPYWYYNVIENEKNQFSLKSNKPSLGKMESDLERYIALELPGCLNNYEPFIGIGFEIEEVPTYDVISTIAPGVVRFSVRHKITASRGGSEQDLENFFVEIPVDLMHIHEIASLIFEAEENSTMLENHFQNLYALYADTDAKALPPAFRDTFEVVNSVSWKESEVKERIKTLLMSYVPFIQYYRSRNFVNYNVEQGTELTDVKTRVLNNMIIPYTGAEDLEVRFQYLDLWDIYFDTNAEGDTIEPTGVVVDFFFGKFGWQNFRTFYDISYPVFVSLYDPEAMNGLGYYFNFALEANIRNNQPIQGIAALPPAISEFDASLMCNAEQRQSDLITIKVLDGFYGTPLSDTSVLYTVGEERCMIGRTDASGILQARFPVAIGGIVSFMKNNYLGTSRLLDTTGPEAKTQLQAEIWQMKTLEVGVGKMQVYNCKEKGGAMACYLGEQDPLFGLNNVSRVYNENDVDLAFVSGPQNSERADRSVWYINPLFRSLEDNEQGTVTLERIDIWDESFSSGTAVTGKGTQRIMLVPGVYRVNMVSFIDEATLIPAERRCDGDECFTISEISMEQTPTGGLKLVNVTTYLQIEPSELYSADKVFFIGLSPSILDIPEDKRVPEDMEVFGQIDEMSIKFKNWVKPIFG